MGFGCKNCWLSIVGAIRVLSFDHRKSATSKIDSAEDCLENTTFHIDLEKCSATTAYEYFSQKLAEMNLPISGVSTTYILSNETLAPHMETEKRLSCIKGEVRHFH